MILDSPEVERETGAQLMRGHTVGRATLASVSPLYPEPRRGEERWQACVAGVGGLQGWGTVGSPGTEVTRKEPGGDPRRPQPIGRFR